MAWKLTIGAADKTSNILRESGVSIDYTLNERATARFTCNPGYVPARYADVVIYAQDGTTPIFGGVITTRRTKAFGSEPNTSYATEIECADYGVYADWCYQTKTYTVGPTLKVVLQDLIADQLTAYGITLDAAQVTGPTLAVFTWTTMRVADCLRELSDRTGYVWRVDRSKVLRMFTPGTDAAPYTITTATPNVLDLHWSDASNPPANHIRVLCGPTGTWSATQTWTANGADTSWITDLPSAVTDPGYVTVGGVFCTVGTGAMFTWAQATHTLSVGTAATPSVGTSIVLVYTAQGPFPVTAIGAGTPTIWAQFAVEEILTLAAGQEYANGILAQMNQQPIEVTATSRKHGWAPGQALTVNVTTRGLNSTFAITSVSLALNDNATWVYTIVATETTVYGGSYLDEWRSMGGSGATSGVSVSVGGGAGGAAVLHAHLGGDRYQPKISASWTPIVSHVPFVCPISGSYTMRAFVQTDDAGTTVQARIYDVTAAAAVTGSTTAASTSMAGETKTASVALIVGHEYQAEMIGSNASAGVRVGYCTVQL